MSSRHLANTEGYLLNLRSILFFLKTFENGGGAKSLLKIVDLEKELTWGNVPGKFISPRFLETDVVWSGNTVAGKAKNLLRCREDFKKLGAMTNVNK